MHSLHLLAAVRGPGLLEVDANANPLREGAAARSYGRHATAAFPFPADRDSV